MQFSGTYAKDDVIFLLRNDETIPLLTREEKEKKMHDGVHYSDLLSKEDEPSSWLIKLYLEALEKNAQRLATESLALAKTILSEKSEPVLVSLVRAGVPLGCLLRRAMNFLGRKIPHYGLSIIRDRGIDQHPQSEIIFIDGWTGKGTIAKELKKALPNSFLAVLSDPCGFADISASGEDWLIPFGMLNSIVSGGISRSVWNESSFGFHRCRFLSPKTEFDQSRSFLNAVEKLFPTTHIKKLNPIDKNERNIRQKRSQELLSFIQQKYKITNINGIKPGLAEAGRAVLRRTPAYVLLSTSCGWEGDFLRKNAQLRGLIPVFEDIAPYHAITLLTL